MTRTSTELPRLEPESSASTNSAMAAFIAFQIIVAHATLKAKRKMHHLDFTQSQAYPHLSFGPMTFLKAI